MIRFAAPLLVLSGSIPKVYLALSFSVSPASALQLYVPSAFSSPTTIANDCIEFSSGLFSGVPVHMET